MLPPDKSSPETGTSTFPSLSTTAPSKQCHQALPPRAGKYQDLQTAAKGSYNEINVEDCSKWPIKQFLNGISCNKSQLSITFPHNARWKGLDLNCNTQYWGMDRQLCIPFTDDCSGYLLTSHQRNLRSVQVHRSPNYCAVRIQHCTRWQIK